MRREIRYLVVRRHISLASRRAADIKHERTSHRRRRKTETRIRGSRVCRRVRGAVRERERAAGPCPVVIILQLGYLPVTYFSSPSLLQSEWAVGQVRSSHVKTPVASSLVETTTSELRVTIKMAVTVVARSLFVAAATAAAAAAAAAAG